MGNTISYDTKPHTLALEGKGSLKGTQFSAQSRRYAGVPYALPPTGEHRWRKPRALPASYEYTDGQGNAYDASQFQPVCPQEIFHAVAKAEGESERYSEDCLKLNIWTPVCGEGENVKGKRWPVVLWLHGGWFAMGDPSQEPGMDPTELISTGGLKAIFVAIGYRLNIFGFLAGQALKEESNGEAAGNFGLWDQRLAMEWVKENIHHFGGDPDNVTLGGRSAGSYGVQAQVLYELRKGSSADEQLFKRFFMYSNAIPAQPKSLEDVQPQFDEVCEHFKVSKDLSGAQKLETLRKISWKDLVASLKSLKYHTFRPMTDDLFIHSGMMEYCSSGAFAREFKKRKLRVLIGEVRNEETLYSQYNAPKEPTVEALKIQLANYYAPATVERILPHYNLPQTQEVQAWATLFGEIIADGQVRAPSRLLVKQLVDHGANLNDVWRYQVAYRLSFIDEKVAPLWMGVAHAMDKPFWKYAYPAAKL